MPGMRWSAAGLAIALICAMAGGASAQGLVKGIEQGARQGNKAAGPVGGVLGGAIGGVVGVFTGVLGVGSQPQGGQQQAAPAKDATKPGATKAERRQAARAKTEIVPMTPEQIVAASDANIERIKTELKLTPDQEKHWGGFTSAMHYLGRNGADRVALRASRARRDPPDDVIEQMRNEAQFLNDRAVDQRNVADAAEPLYASLDDKQKAAFIAEMVKLSRERGLD